ncbi:MAG: Deoxyribose-phosphate aldolase [Idiomarina sp. T82-3]|uniref:deoxyribose-phosphate aldolase n=1 Tax=Idiomarina TaxID=135575 RepID=UPI000799716A|nr:deoxyribose-phosphate aldolase [Idiomarina sp. T82-3]KXS35343.1 MAG: Deoxyribose-phosphate aldolase [Idiomarina sp. T82-3]
MNQQAALAFRCMDLTSLGNQDTPEMIEALCAKARYHEHQVAAICVFPEHVTTAKRALNAQVGPTVPVATVTNFPQGSTDVVRAVEETQRALAAGADEIDVVLPYHALLAGDKKVCEQLVGSVKDACGDTALLKVIIESGELQTAAQIRLASQLSIANGADFIKTSTGKVPINATLMAAKEMLHVIATDNLACGFKAAGRIRTLADAVEYFALAESILGSEYLCPKFFRLGASSLLTDLIEHS